MVITKFYFSQKNTFYVSGRGHPQSVQSLLLNSKPSTRKINQSYQDWDLEMPSYLKKYLSQRDVELDCKTLDPITGLTSLIPSMRTSLVIPNSTEAKNTRLSVAEYEIISISGLSGKSQGFRLTKTVSICISSKGLVSWEVNAFFLEATGMDIILQNVQSWSDPCYGLWW